MTHVSYIDVRNYFLGPEIVKKYGAGVKLREWYALCNIYAERCSIFGVSYLDFTKWVRSDFAEHYYKYTPEQLIMFYKLSKGD